MKKLMLIFVSILLVLSIAGCGMNPKEKLVDALENGEVIDYTKPFQVDFEFNIDRLNVEVAQASYSDQMALDIINQLAGSTIKGTIQEDLATRTTAIHTEGTLFETPFTLDVFFTEDQYILNIEGSKDLIAKLEAMSGESMGIPFESLNSYLYGSYGNSYEVEQFFGQLDDMLANYKDYEKMGNKVAVPMVNYLDPKYFKEQGDYVVLSFNNENLKELITKVLDDFESDPEGTIDNIFASIEEMYPVIAEIAESDPYADVPSKEEFMSELNSAKAMVLMQVQDKNQLKQLRSTVDQMVNTFTSFIDIKAYEAGYEIEDGNIVGSMGKVDFTVNQSFIIPAAFDFAVTATSHFEELDGQIKIPELTPDNSTNMDNFGF